MSQSATAPAPAPAVPAAAPPATAGHGTPAPSVQPAGHRFVDTPRLLNRWQLVGMSTAIVFGLLSALVQLLSWQADGRAAADTEQLVRVQEIQSSLLRADALATNGFLQKGPDDPEQRAEYDAEIDRVLRLVTDAAEAQSADREALATLNQQVADYTTAVAQARDYERQGLPVGSEYLSGASAALRADTLPVLDSLAEANEERAQDAMGGQHPVWLLALGLLTLAALWWLNRQLAQHFRRHVNTGIALAAAIVLAVTLVTAGLAFGRAGDNDALQTGSFRTAIDQAAARTAGNDAKAQESLGLIKRGSGAIIEEDWRASAEVVEDRATPETLELWEQYVAGHREIRRLDDVDRWARARTLATSREDQSSTEAFDEFDRASQEVVDDAAAEATAELRSGRPLALVLVVATLLLGVAAAVAVARGIAARRREYA